MSAQVSIRIVASILLAVALPLFACVSYSVAVESIKIGGTGTGLGTMKLLGEEFEKTHPGVKVQIIPNLGGGGGIISLLNGNLDIAISGSALNSDGRVSGMAAFEYARTPFVFVVHKNVVKSGVTIHELENIFSGAVNKWPGGKRIRVVLRPEADTDTRIVSAISPGMSKSLKVARTNKGRILAITDQESAETVAKTPGAIGTSTLTQIATEKRPLKVLAFDGTVPNLTSVSNGNYPLYKSLYLVTTSRASNAARQFADFVRSSQGAIILAQSGNLAIGASAK